MKITVRTHIHRWQCCAPDMNSVLLLKGSLKGSLVHVWISFMSMKGKVMILFVTGASHLAFQAGGSFLGSGLQGSSGAELCSDLPLSSPHLGAARESAPGMLWNSFGAERLHKIKPGLIMDVSPGAQRAGRALRPE